MMTNTYEILMNSGEKITLTMSHDSMCLIKQFANTAVGPGNNIMLFDDTLAIRCSDVSAIKKLSSTSR